MRNEEASRTLAVLLGASKFPKDAGLSENRSFSASAEDVKEYLVDKNGFGVPQENLLWLFDSLRSQSDQLTEIAGFLMRRMQQLESEGSPASNLLVYYVGHGLFTRGADQAYCLAVRRTNSANEGATSIRTVELANTIKDHARFLRRFLIFDSCFAASAFKEFQAGPQVAAIMQIKKEFPEDGTSLLCASSSDLRAKAPVELNRTMFSSALIHVLRNGTERAGQHLSFNELCYLITDNLRSTHPDTWVRPEMHSPDQHKGDIAHLPLFPNPAYRSPQTFRARARSPQAERPLAASQPVREKLARTSRESQERNGYQANEKSRLAAQLAAADKILERQKRKRAQAAEKRRITAERTAAAQKAAERSEQRRIARGKRLAQQLEESSSEQNDSVWSNLKREQPVLTAYAKTPTQESSSLGIGGWLGLVGAMLAVNLVGYVVGRVWALFTANGSIFGWHSFIDLFWAYLIGGGILGVVFGKILNFIDESGDLHLVSFVMWPGFLIGFRFVNDLTPDMQPTIWLGLLAVAGFLLGALGKKT